MHFKHHLLSVNDLVRTWISYERNYTGRIQINRAKKFSKNRNISISAYVLLSFYHFFGTGSIENSQNDKSCCAQLLTKVSSKRYFNFSEGTDQPKFVKFKFFIFSIVADSAHPMASHADVTPILRHHHYGFCVPVGLVYRTDVPAAIYEWCAQVWYSQSEYTEVFWRKLYECTKSCHLTTFRASDCWYFVKHFANISVPVLSSFCHWGDGGV